MKRSERSEAKLDAILRQVDPDGTENTLASLARRYPDH